jgi:hypothetical protein
MFLTIQQLVNGEPVGLEYLVQFKNGGILMQSDYEHIGHGEIRRSLSNKALGLSNDNIKYGFQVNGSGWQKPGLDSINWNSAVRIGCIAPFAQQTDGSAITPVRTARSDIAPYAFAMTSGGLVSTPLEGWAPVPVAGALYYNVYFFPVMDGIARYRGKLDQGGARYSWTLDFQEK